MSPELVQAISGLGALGFAIIAVWGFATGRIRVGSLVDRDITQIRAERDAFRDLHAGALVRLDRVADATERLTAVVDKLADERQGAIADAVRDVVKQIRSAG